MTESTAPEVNTEVAEDSTAITSADNGWTLYQEAIAELATTHRDVAKAKIVSRVREIEKLRRLLTIAEEDLKELLACDVQTIAEFKGDKRS